MTNTLQTRYYVKLKQTNKQTKTRNIDFRKQIDKKNTKKYRIRHYVIRPRIYHVKVINCKKFQYATWVAVGVMTQTKIARVGS